MPPCTIHRTRCSAGVPATLKAQGLLRDDGKNPDGVTLVPWTKGLTWDATCSDTPELYYLSLSLTSKAPRAAAQSAEQRKHSKYAMLPSAYILCPSAVKTLDPFGVEVEAIALVDELGRRLHLVTGERTQVKIFPCATPEHRYPTWQCRRNAGHIPSISIF